jgi:hypothetical protein
MSAPTPSAGGDYEFVLSAQFTSTINEPPIERVESFRVAVAVPPPPPLPGFNLSLGTGPKIYAPRGSVPIVIERVNGFAEDIALTLAPVVSPPGATGSFAPALVPGSTGAATLNLEIPPSTGQGALMTLRVTGTSTLTGKVQTRTSAWRSSRCFSMSVTPNGGTASSNPPLDVLVKVSFDPAGPFAAAPPRVTFSLPPDEVPDGLQYQFLEGDVATTYSVGTTIHRTLRLITDGRAIPTGVLSVTATASLDPTPVYSAADVSADGHAGFRLGVRENGATYTNPPTEKRRHRDRHAATRLPAGDRLVGRSGRHAPGVSEAIRRHDLRRLAFAGAGQRSQGPVRRRHRAGADGPLAQRRGPSRLHLQDGAHEGSAVGLGTTRHRYGGRLVGGQRIPGQQPTQHARSPRIATPTAPGQALALSYLVEEGESPVTASDLFVRWTAVRDPWRRCRDRAAARSTPPLTAAWSATATSLALAARRQALGRLDRAAGGRVDAAGTLGARPRRRVMGAAAVSADRGSAVGRSHAAAGRAVGRRRRRLARGETGAGLPGAVAVGPSRPGERQLVRAHEYRQRPGLAQHPQGGPSARHGPDARRDGRLVIAWTEETNEGGSAISRLWAKRQSADGTWPLLGMVIDLSKARHPFIAGDSNSHLYVNWLRIYDTSPAQLRGDVFVARWVFP